MNNTRKAKLAELAIIPTLAVGALAGTVFAASATTTTTPASSIARSFKDKGPKDTTQFAADLASVLGLSATDVKAQLDAGTSDDAIITAAGKTETDVDAQMKTLRDTATKAKLTADVAAGTITQAQADQMITNMANHIGGPGKGHSQKDSTQFAADLASVLGLNATDVKTKLDAGTKPADIITATGKTEADVMAQLKIVRDTEMKTRLAADVASGKITQAQADTMIAQEATETHDGHHGGFKGIKTTITSSTTSTQ